MFYQVLPNIIFILAVSGILLMILRHLPNAADLEKMRPQEPPLEQKLAVKGLPVEAVKKLMPILRLWTKKSWNFMLEAKDLKPAAIPGYRFKKIFRHKVNPNSTEPKPTILPATTTAEVKNEKHYLEIIKKEPKNLANYDALGKFYLETGNYSDAKDIYLYLTSHRATNSDYHGRLAFCMYQLEQYAKAVEHYHKSLALDSSQPNRYYNLGLSFEALGKHREAVRALEQAVALEPVNAKFNHSLSNAYKKIGEAQKAEGILRQMPKEAVQDKKVKVLG